MRKPLPLLTVAGLLLGTALFTLPRPSAADVAGDQESANYAQGQALLIYQTFKNRDWKKLYYLVGLTPKLRANLATTSAEEFGKQVAKGIEDTGQGEVVRKLCEGIQNISSGDAVVKGNTATVPTASNVTFNGSTAVFKGEVRLIRIGTAWKWDLTTDEDLQKVMGVRIQEMFGKPEPVAK